LKTITDICNALGWNAKNNTPGRKRVWETIKSRNIATTRVPNSLNPAVMPKLAVSDEDADALVQLLSKSKPFRKYRRQKASPDLAKVQEPPKKATAELHPAEVGTRKDLDVTLRKLIHLCEVFNISTITIQDGEAEVIETITTTKTFKIGG
jgi:hypothetical protein